MQIITLAGGVGWHVQDLRRAAGLLGIELTPCAWRDLVGTVGLPGPAAYAGDTVLDNADLILLRTMPPGSLEQIVFRMDLIHHLVARGKRVFNPPRAIEIAVDKYLALARLSEAGLPVPETIVCQRLSEALAALQRLGGDAVVKPIFGSEGFGITRVSDPDVAGRVFAALERINAVMYLQHFIDHGGADYRLFVLGDRVVAAMRRTHPTDWRTNIARGAAGEAVSVEPALEKLALRAAAACGAAIAGVDLAIDHSGGGKPFVLEVNAVPGWRELARVTGRDIAAEVLEFVAKTQDGTA